MENIEVSKQLSTQPIDYFTSAIKSIFGAAPYVGSLFSELAGTVIPNQRVDRIASFVEKLDKKVANLEKEFLMSQLSNKYFSDLLEESLHHVVRAITDERREYIANLISNSLSLQDIQYIESKHLLRILGELNDIEIIWLNHHQRISHGHDREFYNKHLVVLEPVFVSMADPPLVHNKEAIQNSYKEHLSRLGLLKPIYETYIETQLPKFDKHTGGQKVWRYEITTLGRFFLRQIGITPLEK
jgi:outer membrane murein-binding lipoprotein Lpp